MKTSILNSETLKLSTLPTNQLKFIVGGGKSISSVDISMPPKPGQHVPCGVAYCNICNPQN